MSTKVDVYSIRQSLGVVAVISPFNFPAMVPMWFVPIAIACGNAVVIKPSEKDPSAVNAVAALWREAGLPEGVANVVHGDKGGRRRPAHPPVGQVGLLRRLDADRQVRLRDRHRERQAGPGPRRGEEPHARPARCGPRPAADAAVNAGFGSAGERCMAISALIAVEPVADELISKITDRMGKLVTGDGTGAATWARW